MSLNTRPAESAAADLTDADVLPEAVEWLRGLDVAAAGPETRAAVTDAIAQAENARELEAIGAAPRAIEFAFDLAARLLIIAQATHRQETGTLVVEDEPISAEEFRRCHIAPIEAETRRVMRAIRRQARPVRRCARRSRRRCAGHRRSNRTRAGPGDGLADSDDDPPAARPRRATCRSRAPP